MKRAGYTAGMLGKWHLGAARQFHPNRRGYDHFFGFLGGGHQYFDVDLTRALGEGYFSTLQRNGKPVDLVFMLMAPEGTGTDHIKALATVSRILRDADNREALRSSTSIDEMRQIMLYAQ